MKHFSLSEFACPCCGKNEMDPAFLTLLDEMREMAGTPFLVESGYRCEAHNAAVGGKPTSSHLKGLAVDLKVVTSRRRYLILWAAMVKGIDRIGIGKNFIHLDVDDGKDESVAWMY